MSRNLVAAAAFLAAALFLLDNGFEIAAKDEAIIATVLSLADGATDERAFALWLADNTARAKD